MSALAYAADAILERMRDDEESDWTDRLLEALNAEPRPNPWRSDEEPLTDKERLTLFCLSVGLEQLMTSQVLSLAPETVKTHLTKARRVLGAKNTTHAVALAIRQGLIP